MKKTLLTLVLTMAAIAGAVAQSITSATISYTFNGKADRMTLPASDFSTLDLSGTVAENFKIDGVTVQTSGNVNDVTMYAAEYKSGDKDVEIDEIPLVAQESQAGDGTVWWYIPELPGNGWIVKDNNRSTATRYFRFNFVANKDKSPAYYNNGGNDYQIRFKTDDGQGGGSGGEGNITFYDKNTATLSLGMTGGWSSNLTYTYAGDGSRDISDNPGGVTSLDISGFTLRLQRASADLEIKSVSVQYKVFEEGSGSEGQWNTLNYDFQEDEGGNILAKKYTGTTSTPDLTYGLKQGPTYILDVKYQVVDKSDNYYFFKPSRVYKFSVNDSGGGGGGESVRGDLNGDGEVSMPDVMFLIQRILNGKFPDE